MDKGINLINKTNENKRILIISNRNDDQQAGYKRLGEINKEFKYF